MQSSLLPPETSGYLDYSPKLAKVVNVYPEANMVDLLFLDGSVFHHVHVVSPYASNKTGLACLSLPKYNTPLESRTDATIATSEETENDVLALVIFAEGVVPLPIVIGFIYPEESEVLCSTEQEGNEKGTQHIWKHQSNVYTRVDDAGDIEISHPSGVLVKIGKNTERTSILNYDRLVRPFKWKNTDTDELSPAPYIFINHPSGTYFIIDPEGNIVENCVGNVTRTITGNLIETIGGDKLVTVVGNIAHTAGVTITEIAGTSLTETAGTDCLRTAIGIIKDTATRIDHN